VRLVGTTDAIDDEFGLGLFDRADDLVVAEQRRIVRRRLARICGLASQTISWLTTASVPVTQTIRTKNQIGSASQLWTRNHSFERDFFDMIRASWIDEGPLTTGFAAMRSIKGRPWLLPTRQDCIYIGRMSIRNPEGGYERKCFALRTNNLIPVGVSLLAIAMHQPTHLLADTPLSRAGSLPQGIEHDS
jgi:hypothetical protein